MNSLKVGFIGDYTTPQGLGFRVYGLNSLKGFYKGLDKGLLWGVLNSLKGGCVGHVITTSI